MFDKESELICNCQKYECFVMIAGCVCDYEGTLGFEFEIHWCAV